MKETFQATLCFETVAAGWDVGRTAMPPHNRAREASLYATNGTRKYLNRSERRRALAVMQTLKPDRALFALVLAYTGGRVSEILALTPSSFQIEHGLVALRTLKRRRHVVREVPIPPALMAALVRHFGLPTAQRNPETASTRLWPWRRETAWKLTKQVMNRAGIFGRHACPRGLRHAFGIGALQAGTPLTLVQTWLGHASLGTTAIYSAACGPEEMAFAERFWRANNEPLSGISYSPAMLRDALQTP